MHTRHFKLQVTRTVYVMVGSLLLAQEPMSHCLFVLMFFQAHGALDSVYHMCVKDISTEQLGQVSTPYFTGGNICLVDFNLFAQ